MLDLYTLYVLDAKKEDQKYLTKNNFNYFINLPSNTILKYRYNRNKYVDSEEVFREYTRMVMFPHLYKLQDIPTSIQRDIDFFKRKVK